MFFNVNFSFKKLLSLFYLKTLILSTVPSSTPLPQKNFNITIKKHFSYLQPGQCCNTFCGRDLRTFIISWSVCSWWAFTAWSNVMGKFKSYCINPIEGLLSGASLGYFPALLTNIRLSRSLYYKDTTDS